MSISKGSPPGRYVVAYFWRGYMDAIDVDVLPDKRPVPVNNYHIYGSPNTAANAPAHWDRHDHCHFSKQSLAHVATGKKNMIAWGVDLSQAADKSGTTANTCGKWDSWNVERKRNGITHGFALYRTKPGTKLIELLPKTAYNPSCFVVPPPNLKNSYGQTREQALSSCRARCQDLGMPSRKNSGCAYVQLVPLVPPARVRHLSAAKFEQSIPWWLPGQPQFAHESSKGKVSFGPSNCVPGCLNATKEPAGSQVCSAVNVNVRNEVGEPWRCAEKDPTDEAWYSTVFVKGGAWKFASPLCGKDCDPTSKSGAGSPWHFGEGLGASTAACVSCKDAERNVNRNASTAWQTTPHWETSRVCRLCHRDTSLQKQLPYVPPPVDCVGKYGVQSACSTTCGAGTQSQVYKVSVALKNGGKACDAKDGAKKSQGCKVKECPPPPTPPSSDASAEDGGGGSGGIALVALVLGGLVLLGLMARSKGEEPAVDIKDIKFEAVATEAQRLHEEL